MTVRHFGFRHRAGGRRGKNKLRLWRRLLCFFAILALLFFVFLRVDEAVRPTASLLLAQEAKSRVLLILEQAAAEVMAGESDLFSMHRDTEERITDYSLDTARLQQIKARWTETVTTRLTDQKQMTAALPWGSLTGSAFLSGRGGEVTFALRCVSAPEIQLKGEFASGGINQTIYRLWAITRVQLWAGVPLVNAKTEVNSTILLQEQVVVGSVPNLLGSWAVP